ncbi:hypothetical protein HYDPIDRAFT_154224 [Hydnomerulius pinastri MD-312]|uniref:glutathione transferase n=1 Tax=Hydnomerulius pinastri MD-312 TaxID=994086 RepID=A0A0C9VG51_9AGAM|nr:hypothetical protein HYDPIDRAFT_154224 [Hydnomerulius pinastri MD-312]
MVLKLYGHAHTICTRRVAVVIKELDIPYEFVRVDFLNGETRDPEFLEKQPFGQLPYIDDGGFILFESRAIARYLVKKYTLKGSPSLIPSKPKEEAIFEQAASIETTNFEPHAMGISLEKFYNPMCGTPTNEARLLEHAALLDAKMGAYESILSRHQYLAGDSITLADLFHLPFGKAVVDAGFGDIFEKRPNLGRWWIDVSTRPSWLAVKDGSY